MEKKWIMTGIALVCTVACTALVLSLLMNTPANSIPQGSATGFILGTTLPDSPATAPVYNVVRKESVFEGSEKVMEVKPSIPSEDEAVIFAEKILADYGGLPDDAVLSQVKQVYLGGYNLNSETVEEQYPQFTQVIYTQQINGSPVAGPGAEINIELGENGELLHIEKAWRHVEYGGEVPIISAAEAYEKLQRHELLEIPQSSLSGITISEVNLGYYAEHRDHDQKVYSPIWIFSGYKQGGQPFPYMVDARRDPAQVGVSSVQDSLTLHPTPVVAASAQPTPTAAVPSTGSTQDPGAVCNLSAAGSRILVAVDTSVPIQDPMPGIRYSFGETDSGKTVVLGTGDVVEINLGWAAGLPFRWIVSVSGCGLELVNDGNYVQGVGFWNTTGHYRARYRAVSPGTSVIDGKLVLKPDEPGDLRINLTVIVK